MATWEENIEAELELEHEIEHARDNSSRHRVMTFIVIGAVALVVNAFIILSGKADSIYSLIQF